MLKSVMGVLNFGLQTDIPADPLPSGRSFPENVLRGKKQT